MIMAEEKKKMTEQQENKAPEEKKPISENWAHEIIEDMDDFIESQGIYLRP